MHRASFAPPVARLRSTHFALVAALSVGCVTVQETADHAGFVRDAGFRCVLAEADVTVYSPFDAEHTETLLETVRVNVAAIERGFDVEMPASLEVLYTPVPVDPLELPADATRGTDWSARLKLAGGAILAVADCDPKRPRVVINVPLVVPLIYPDGTRELFPMQLDTTRTLRHELAHVGAALAGLEGSTWFDEGIAEEFESREFDASGDLVPVALPANLACARRFHRGYSIENLLLWAESVRDIESGLAVPFSMGRSLAHSLIRYLLDVTPGTSLREQLSAILALSDAELRAHEAGWKAWLDAYSLLGEEPVEIH